MIDIRTLSKLNDEINFAVLFNFEKVIVILHEGFIISYKFYLLNHFKMLGGKKCG